MRGWRRVTEPSSGIDDDTGSATEPAPSETGRPRWQIAIFQLLFGSMAVALGGLISAEPTLSLERREDGRLACRYALDAFGWLPTLTASLDDLVRYEVSVGEASGTQGMAGGQAIDLAATGQRLAPGQIESMHALKTGALIRASVLMACAAKPGLADREREALDRYGRAIGLSFQIVDDLLDVLGDPAVTGKVAGSDALRGKPTYPAVAGVAAARARAAELADEGVRALAGFGPGADRLREFAGDLVRRGR